jgi:hypothetical protein
MFPKPVDKGKKLDPLNVVFGGDGLSQSAVIALKGGAFG